MKNPASLRELCLDQLTVDEEAHTLVSLRKLARKHPAVDSLPQSLRILLENVIRNLDGQAVRDQDAEAI
ncbi:hypothetical protein B2A_02866 [mine drainage metagenome]